MFPDLFPMNDPASAELMQIKALCLYGAGVIDPDTRARVLARANAVLNAARGKDVLNMGRLDLLAADSAVLGGSQLWSTETRFAWNGQCP